MERRLCLWEDFMIPTKKNESHFNCILEWDWIFKVHTIFNMKFFLWDKIVKWSNQNKWFRSKQTILYAFSFYAFMDCGFSLEEQKWKTRSELNRKHMHAREVQVVETASGLIVLIRVRHKLGTGHLRSLERHVASLSALVCLCNCIYNPNSNFVVWILS